MAMVGASIRRRSGRRLLTLAVVAVTVLAGMVVAAAATQAIGANACDYGGPPVNPVQNCGFEQGLADWTSTGHNGYGPAWANTGDNGAYLATVGAAGTLSQTLAGLKPDTAYNLDYFLKNITTGGTNSFAVRVSDVVGGTLTFDSVTDGPQTSWTQYTDTFTTLADGTQPTIAFVARADNGSWALDDVWIAHGPSDCDQSPSPIVNCGFETGTFNGWTSTGNNGLGYDWAHSGADGASLAGTLSQTFGSVNPLNAGAPYLLSYWVENPTPGTPNSFAVQISNVVGGTLTFDSMTDAGAFGWTEHTDSFVTLADGTQPTISFVARNDSAAFGLDDVVLHLGPSLCDAVPGNLVQNCGFESGAAHWTIAGDAGSGSAQPHSGSAGGYLTNPPPYNSADSTLSQTLAGTVPGTPYTFSYWRSHTDYANDNFFQVLVANVVGGPLTFDLTGDLPKSRWAQFSHTFTTLPDGTAPTITFDSFNQYGYWDVDDVVVTPKVRTTPVITWADPAAIAYGTALSSTQLDATADVQGTFTYTPPAGTVLSAGTHDLQVDFTPTDTTDYTTASKTVQLVVYQAPAITSADHAGFVTQRDNSFQVDASGGYPAGPVTFSESGALPPGVTFSSSGLLSGDPPASASGDWPITITADNGYAASSQQFVLTVRTPRIPVPAQAPPGTGLLHGVQLVTSPGSTVTWTGSGYAPDAPVTLLAYPTWTYRNPIVLGYYNAGNTGHVTMRVHIPAGLRGVQYLVAGGYQSQGQVQYLIGQTDVEPPPPPGGILPTTVRFA